MLGCAAHSLDTDGKFLIAFGGTRCDVQLDSALLEKQSEAYAVQGVDESEPAKAVPKKRKPVYTNGEDVRIGSRINLPARLAADRARTGRRRTSRHLEEIQTIGGASPGTEKHRRLCHFPPSRCHGAGGL